MVLYPERNPHVFFRREFFYNMFLYEITRAGILLAMQRREIPRELSQTIFCPTFSQRYTMDVFLKSCGTTQVSHMAKKTSRSFFARFFPSNIRWYTIPTRRFGRCLLYGIKINSNISALWNIDVITSSSTNHLTFRIFISILSTEWVYYAFSRVKFAHQSIKNNMTYILFDLTALVERFRVISLGSLL